MGYGNGMAGSKKMVRKPAIRRKIYRKEFAAVYSNARSNRGDCVITSRSRRMTNVPGTLTYKEGSPKVKFLSDDGRTSFAFSLRDITRESLSRGVHAITIP